MIKSITQQELFNSICLTLGRSCSLSSTANPAPRPLDPVNSNSKTQAGMRVLLAEDNAINQKLALRILEKAGYNAMLAHNGQEAVEMAAASAFDLILMDMQMPVMGGIEATRKIREHEQETQTHIPIIGLTANAMASDRDACFAAGMDGYVSEPIRTDLLFEEIQRVFSSLGIQPRTQETLPSFSQEETLSIFNQEESMARMGGDKELLLELAQIFFADYPAKLEEMRKAIEQENAKQLALSAHHLRGSASTFSAKRLEQITRELEKEANTGSLHNAASLFKGLENEMTTFEAHFRSLMGMEE